MSKYKINEGTSVVGVLPSEVIRRRAVSSGNDYVDYNVKLIKKMLHNGYEVVLLAYSARGNTNSLHNNDLPVCRNIAAEIHDDNFYFIDEELSAQQLKSIIGNMEVVICSRFHAMIAALSTVTPVLVIGWSHKYFEIMKMFKLEKYTSNSSDYDSAKTFKEFSVLYNNRDSVKEKIKVSLPKIKLSAERQVEAIVQIKSN